MSKYSKAEVKGWFKAHEEEALQATDRTVSVADWLVDAWIENHDYDCDSVAAYGSEAWLYEIMEEIAADD